MWDKGLAKPGSKKPKSLSSAKAQYYKFAESEKSRRDQAVQVTRHLIGP